MFSDLLLWTNTTLVLHFALVLHTKRVFFLFPYYFLCVYVSIGSEAQWTEQHAGALQAEVTYSTLRGRRRLLSVLQCPHPWTGILPHPQTRETHQEETLSRCTHWNRILKILKVAGWDAGYSSQRLHCAPLVYHGEIQKEQKKRDWIFWLTVIWAQSDTGLWRNFLNCYLLLLHMSFLSVISFLFFLRH